MPSTTMNRRFKGFLHAALTRQLFTMADHTHLLILYTIHPAGDAILNCFHWNLPFPMYKCRSGRALIDSMFTGAEMQHPGG